MKKMSGSITAYKNWAPDGIVWTQWVKPVLFADQIVIAKPKAPVIDDDFSFEVKIPPTIDDNFSFEVKIPNEASAPPIDWMESVAADTAIILDRPGIVGVCEAMILARKGYRPVPLYNGVNGVDRGDIANKDQMLVDSQVIAEELFKHADELSALGIDDDAPPVFMLDSNRMCGGDMPYDDVYDNRWCVFPQDMPSATFLLKHGIKKFLVRADNMEDDLGHILRRYKKQGLKILECGKDGVIKEWEFFPASQYFKSLLYRAKVTLGLKRNAAGGFGGRYMDYRQMLADSLSTGEEGGDEGSGSFGSSRRYGGFGGG